MNAFSSSAAARFRYASNSSAGSTSPARTRSAAWAAVSSISSLTGCARAWNAEPALGDGLRRCLQDRLARQRRRRLIRAQHVDDLDHVRGGRHSVEIEFADLLDV